MQNFKSIVKNITKSQSIAIGIAKFQKYCNTLQYYWNHPCSDPSLESTSSPFLHSLSLGSYVGFLLPVIKLSIQPEPFWFQYILSVNQENFDQASWINHPYVMKYLASTTGEESKLVLKELQYKTDNTCQWTHLVRHPYVLSNSSYLMDRVPF